MNRISLTCALVLTTSHFAFAGTVAHWRFEGEHGTVAADQFSIIDSANGHHGTPLGGPIYRSASEDSTGLEFDGATTRVFVRDSPQFEISGSLTIEAIVEIRSIGERQQIFHRGDNRGGFDAYQLRISRNGFPVFNIDTEEGRRTSVFPEEPLPLNTPIHLAGTLDAATGDMRLYVDGNSVASRTTDLRPLAKLNVDENPGIGIGSWQNSATDVIDGIIYEIRISDAALTPQEFVPEPNTSIFLYGGLAFMLAMRARNTKKSFDNRYHQDDGRRIR